ncbi:PDZ domain-containing protein [Myxococcota bacterium]|nr:PDZ domain-containing protein [Myxococcota bacterium]
MSTRHPFFAWRFRVLFWAPIVSVILAGLLAVVGRPSPREQAQRIRAAHPMKKGARLSMLSTVLLRVKEDYIDPGRMDPQRMFLAAVHVLERTTPEFISSVDGDEVRVVAGSSEERFHLSEILEPLDLFNAVQQVFQLLARSPDFDPALREIDVINGMLATLDSHTALLPPEVYRELKTGTQGSFSGVGIVVTVKDGYLTVIAPMDGTPAAKAGILPGDRIVRIGDVSVTNTTLSEAVNYLRGKPGTTVSVWIERPSEPQWVHFTLERSIIRLSSVTSQMLPGHIGYVRIRQFSQSTTAELEQHLEKLKADNARGLILDLYNNPGGLLHQAEKCADLFLTEGIIYSAVGQHRRVSEVRRASLHSAIWHQPMIVLVNQGSASAAEILGGALKVHRRALVMGETSFGKGSIQMVNEFDDDSALKMTIAHYLAGGTLAIQSLGVKPHVAVQILDLDHNPHELFQRSRSSGAEPAPLVGQPDVPPWVTVQVVSQRLEGANVQDSDNQAPPELTDAARRLLILPRQHVEWEREPVVAWSRDESDQAMLGLIEQLGKKGVDWTLGNPGQGKARLEARLRLNGDGTIQAGQTLAGIVTLVNLGTSPVFRVGAVIQNTPESPAREYLFGHLDPGEQRTVAFTYPVDANHPRGIWPLTVRFFSPTPISGEEPGVLPADLQTWIEIAPASRPEYQIHHHFMDDLAGNGDGLLQPGEKGRLRIYVMNTGSVAADSVVLGLKVLSPESIEIAENRFLISRLLPQETRSHDFIVTARSDARASGPGLLLRLEEPRFARQFDAQVPLVVRPSAPGPIEVGGIFQFPRNTALVSGAEPESMVIGLASAGATFPVIGSQGQWVKIQLAPDRTAFALRSSGNLVAADSVPLLSPRWIPMWQIQGPRIEVIRDLPLRNRTSPVDLTARLSHPRQILDATVEVFGPQGRYAKVMVASGSGRTELNIAPKIPLFEGKNRVSITLRSTPELKTRWEQICYYSP